MWLGLALYEGGFTNNKSKVSSSPTFPIGRRKRTAPLYLELLSFFSFLSQLLLLELRGHILDDNGFYSAMEQKSSSEIRSQPLSLFLLAGNGPRAGLVGIANELVDTQLCQLCNAISGRAGGFESWPIFNSVNGFKFIL